MLFAAYIQIKNRWNIYQLQYTLSDTEIEKLEGLNNYKVVKL